MMWNVCLREIKTWTNLMGVYCMTTEYMKSGILIALCYFAMEKACSEVRGNYLLKEMTVAKFSTQYHWYSIFNNRFLSSQFHIFWEAIFSVLQFSNICEFYGSIDLKIRFERYKYIKRSLKIRFFSRYIKT